ncbi:hypothetical protein_gp045 [Bacillus phage vB_BceM_WH1]|nr:hypothetical protein_gp045 [Bacillus phage vB_BceM_WH1]
MTNNNIFEMKPIFDVNAAHAVLTTPLDPSWIKTREVQKTKLSYIEGSTVIDLLNTAFNYQWSFEIIDKEVVASLPKAMTEWDNKKKRKVPVTDNDGNQVYQPQPPVINVTGRLTVPGLGFREQYGSKIIIGGATEQEHALKSAATDALKKCASLFGVAAELYRDEYTVSVQEAMQYLEQNNQGYAPEQTQQPQQEQYTAPQPVKDPEPVQQPQQEQQGSKEATGAKPASDWDSKDITKMKELKATLGLETNDDLNPYVQRFFENDAMTVYHITPQNIKAFNIFLARQIEQGA